MVSVDTAGQIEVWDPDTLQLPAGARFKYKSDTDLYDLAKCKATALSLDLSPDGELFACICTDKQVLGHLLGLAFSAARCPRFRARFRARMTCAGRGRWCE